MQLIEQGKMRLDDDVRQIVPEVRDMQILRGFTPEGEPILEDDERPITLKYLHLNHKIVPLGPEGFCCCCC
jgi:CubicO group peptidase (beta-lactamase class C family)